MTNPFVKRAKANLVTRTISPVDAAHIDERIKDMLTVAVETFSPKKTTEEQLRQIARDAYFQGLLDGAQVSALGSNSTTK